MAIQHLHLPPQACVAASQVAAVREGMAVAVAGSDGTVIATISRRRERAAGSTDSDARMSVVSVDGDIDIDTAPLFEQALIVAINDRPRTCLDLRHVDFFGAAGVHALLRAHRHAARLGHSITLHGAHGITERVLVIVGLDHVFPTIA